MDASLLPDHFWSMISWNFLNLAKTLVNEKKFPVVQQGSSLAKTNNYLILIMPQLVKKAEKLSDEDAAKNIRIDAVDTIAHAFFVFPQPMVDYLIQSHPTLLDVC